MAKKTKQEQLQDLNEELAMLSGWGEGSAEEKKKIKDLEKQIEKLEKSK
ncbi:MAG: hypothetical protein V4519_03375 [Patescibacteria group bacterium]